MISRVLTVRFLSQGAASVALTLALGAAAHRAAAADNATDSTDLSAVDDLVVTGTRTAIPAGESLAPTTVLTQQDIEARQVLAFQDLLQGESGIQISNNGGLGKASSVFLRGTNADQVVVLVDGVRMGSATLGTTAFQYLPMDSIGRVEIVRGPFSSLYGSDAMGGVIQIFTKRPTADGATFSADAGAGSHQTSTLGATIGVVSGPWSYGLTASNLTSNGFPNCSGAPYVSPSSPGGGCYVYDPTADGFHNVSGSAQVRYQISDAADVEGMVTRSQGGTRYAGSYTNHEDFAEQAATVSGHWSPADTLRLTAQVGQSKDNELDTLNSVEPPGSLFDTTRNNASVQADWQVAKDQLVTLGSDYLHDAISSDNPFPVTSRVIGGVFGEYQATFGAQQFTASARRDANSQFGSKTTGSAAWGVHLAPSLRLTASYGTAFHAPSFDDLYFPNFGNPNLKPETSQSFDLGLEQRFSALKWSLHGFQTNVRDLITYDGALFAPENTDRARLRGLEFEGGAFSGPWTANLNGSWLDARNVTPGSPNYGLWLPRRARATGRLELARTWDHWRAATLVNIAGPRFDDLANTQPLGGYTTADVLLEWTPVKRWTLQAKIGNATDRRYETALYYPQDRRNFFVTLRYRPAQN